MRTFVQRRWRIERELPETAGLRGLEQLMFERAGTTAEDSDVFLTPDFEDLHDPFLFRDMGLAVELILQLRERGGRILIYGDYDCDGLTSTALMMRFFGKAGIKASYMIPNRLEEGYSLNPQAVQEIIAMRPDLVLTVDCGSSSRAEIFALMQAGIPVILTDHHQVPEEEPFPIAFINPCRSGERYPNRSLAGVGVAFKLVQALSSRLFPEESPAAWLSLAAVGTISDAMPLLGENRMIVQLGLRVFRDLAPLGLLRLAELAAGEKEFTAETISYGIAPRLNAAGRMGDTEPAMRLLLCEDETEAAEGVKILDRLNEQRRELELRITAEAVEQIEAMPASDREHVLMVANRDWHTGVVGIVSSRLCDKYNLPAVCLGGSEEGLRGSARAPEGVDILSLLKNGEELCMTLGGHRQAAGLMLREENFPAFFARVRNAAAKEADHAGERDFTALCELPHELMNEDLIFTLRPFEPFGQQYEEPLFVFPDVEIVSLRPVGENRHLSLRLRLDDLREIAAIGFGLGGMNEIYHAGDRVDILGLLNEHLWNGRSELQIKVTDIRPARSEREYQRAIMRKRQSLTDQADGLSEKERAETGIRVAHIAVFWQWLEQRLSEGEMFADAALLARALAPVTALPVTSANIINMLRVFAEAGLLCLQESDTCVKLKAAAAPEGRRPSLSDQPTWVQLQRAGGIDHGRG